MKLYETKQPECVMMFVATPDDKHRVCLLKDVFLRVDVLLLSCVHNVLLLNALQSKRGVLVLQLYL